MLSSQPRLGVLCRTETFLGRSIMAEDEKEPRSPQEELQDFLKNKLGGDVFTFPLNLGGAPAEAEEASTEPLVDAETRREQLRFDLTPREVKAHLDRFVIGQEAAKKTLAVAICDHYNHVRSLQDRADEAEADGAEGNTVDYVKQNVVLLGPTGVGKTYLIRTLAHMIGVPFVKADVTKFSETGYVGGDVDDLVRELVRAADGDVELAEYGIVFLDEVDKIATVPNTTGRDASGRGVQTGLLKLLEDTDVPARSPQDFSAQFQDMMQLRQGKKAKRTISTKHILFVASGAFSGLAEIIEKRQRERSIGFGSAKPTSEGAKETLAAAITKDFIEFGFEPEFIGRLPIRVSLNELSVDDLFEILTSSEGSIVRQYEENFQGYGIEVGFDSEALRVVALRASEEKTGARGLMTVLESALREFKFHLPGTGVRQLAVTKELVENPGKVLAELQSDPATNLQAFVALGVRRFEREFEIEHAVRLELDDSAVAMACAVAQELKLTVCEHLKNTFRPHADFLKQIAERTGRKRFPVTPQILSRPGEGVECWLRDEPSSQPG